MEVEKEGRGLRSKIKCVDDWIGCSFELPDTDNMIDSLTKHMNARIRHPNCNECQWLNITEVQQERTLKRTVYNEHACMIYGRRLFHRTQNRIHDAFIFPCEECDKDDHAYFERRFTGWK